MLLSSGKDEDAVKILQAVVRMCTRGKSEYVVISHKVSVCHEIDAALQWRG